MHLALGLDKKSYNLSSDDRDPETLLRFATAQNTQYTCRQGLSSLINFGGISIVKRLLERKSESKDHRLSIHAPIFKMFGKYLRQYSIIIIKQRHFIAAYNKAFFDT